ncbi:ankyrin-1-like isoform X1 [Haliotis rubra]|uniref:ankyrin-1-like isoform X1 n=1 Tax=Haliotis rubra TaxID=36100 RepID=UPI001EE617EB|nr:ankyrin-1-like isoform X1 [Haliotis rubra]
MTEMTKRVQFEDDSNSQVEPLHRACALGSLDDIRDFFNSNPKLDDHFYEGLSPLHVAILSDRTDVIDVIDVLVNNGVDVNAQTETNKDTALHLAVENGEFPQNYDVIVKLIDCKADAEIRNKRLRSAYDCALAKGHDLVASTLDGSKSTNEVQNSYRERYGEKYAPILNEAVLESDEDTMKEYIKKGADPNYINKYGAGAIHYALTRCTLPVMRVLDMLISAGADVDLRDDEGDSALNLAIKNEDLRKSGQMMQVVNLLLECGADVTFKDLDGKDALTLAKERQYSDVVAVLNKSKSEHVKEGEQSPEPLPESSSEQSPEPVPVPGTPLPESSSEQSPEPVPGTSPVPKPETMSSPEPEHVVMEALEDTRETDGNVNKPNEDGLYPIHQAVLKDDSDERQKLLETLTEAGADVNVVVKGLGTTPLHLAAEKNRVDSVKFLLEHGADKTKKTLLGKTAFDMASDKGHTEVMELLGDRHDIVQDRWKKGAKKSSSCTIL